MRKRDPFDTLYGKLMRCSRDRDGELFAESSSTWARRATWPMHARLGTISFLALGTLWHLSIYEDEAIGLEYLYARPANAKHSARELLRYETVLPFQAMTPHWAKLTLDEFILSIWAPEPGTVTPLGIPWEIAAISDPAALEAALDAYFGSAL